MKRRWPRPRATTSRSCLRPVVRSMARRWSSRTSTSSLRRRISTTPRTDSSLPVGVEVRDFDDEVVYDASNRSCPGMHGESHNEHGAAFGCIGGVLFLEVHDGEYEHEFIANPSEMREDSRIGSVYGHHHVEHFFGRASYRDDQGFADDGIWLIDVDHSEMRQVFSEPSVSTKFSSDGELLYVLGADGVLHTLGRA